jgi:tyrosine-specific transport protein
VETARYHMGNVKSLLTPLTVVITSYGFSTIIPSLRSYFDNDIRKLRIVILIGSLIPLFCYIAWVAVIFGGIPYEGEYGILSMASTDSTLGLAQSLIHHFGNPSVTTFTNVFTSICVLTSFLGVSLCVVDFLADGFKLEKVGIKSLFLHLATFLPPLVIALIFPAAFTTCLSYAGIFIAILIILFPALMVWTGRYRHHIKADYRVIGGKLPLLLMMLIAIGIIGQGIFWKP